MILRTRAEAFAKKKEIEVYAMNLRKSEDFAVDKRELVQEAAHPRKPAKHFVAIRIISKYVPATLKVRVEAFAVRADAPAKNRVADTALKIRQNAGCKDLELSHRYLVSRRHVCAPQAANGKIIRVNAVSTILKKRCAFRKSTRNFVRLIPSVVEKESQLPFFHLRRGQLLQETIE